MSTRVQVVALTLLAAFVLACLAVVVWRLTYAEEVTDRVTLSVDGVRWTSDLEDALFFSEDAWSPGQTRSAIFWVRNDADVRADIDLHVTGASEEDLPGLGVLELSATVGGGADVQPFVAERDVHTVRVGALDPGRRTSVTLRAEHAGTEEVDSASVRHRISGAGTSLDEPGSRLDATEARLELAPLFLGLALLVTVLVLRRSRPPGVNSSRRP